MNEMIRDIGIIVLIGTGMFIVGWFLKPSEECTQAKAGGLWLPRLSDLSNYQGRYICVNIDTTKSLTQLNKLCQHEVGHEIFARNCETNFTKCLEAEK